MVVVLFDLEGTLVKSVEYDQKAVQEFRTKTREKLLTLGIPCGVLEGLTRSTLMRNRALEYVEEHFDEEDAKRFHLEVDEFLKSYELSWADDSTLFPDTFPTLCLLRKRGHKMGVISNTSRKAASRMLNIHGMVVTREDVKRLKPDPEVILLALKRLNTRDFLFIGDLSFDSKAAENVGGTSIIVNRNRSKKVDFYVDHVVNSLIEVPDIVQMNQKGRGLSNS